jgi:hypothetical protein
MAGFATPGIIAIAIRVACTRQYDVYAVCGITTWRFVLTEFGVRSSCRLSLSATGFKLKKYDAQQQRI